MKIDLDIEFEDDKNLIWRKEGADAAGTNYRLIIKRLQLFVPRLILTQKDKSYTWKIISNLTNGLI